MVEEEAGGSGRIKLGFDDIEEELVAVGEKMCKLVIMSNIHTQKHLHFVLLFRALGRPPSNDDKLVLPLEVPRRLISASGSPPPPPML